MSKTYFNPSIPLQQEIGDQIYQTLQGPVLEFLRHETQGEIFDEYSKDYHESSSMMIESGTFPSLYRLCLQAKKALSFNQNVDFYVVSNMSINACSIASNEPNKHPHIIELNAGIVNLMSEKELLFVLGHEIGHIINGDSQIKKLLKFIYKDDDIPDFISNRLNLYRLLSEIGADRYGYIACGGDEKTSILTMYKIVSGIDLSQMNVNLDGLISENQKHMDYFMDVNKCVGTTHPVHPFRIHALHLYATAQTDEQLTEEMAKIEERFFNLDEEDATFHHFYVAAGILLGSVDHEINDEQIRTIYSHVGDKCWFPVEFTNEVIEKYDLNELYHQTIRLLLEKDKDNDVAMLHFLLEIAFNDNIFSEKELNFIYDFGHEVGWTDRQTSLYITQLLPDHFIFNVVIPRSEEQ